MLLLLLMAGCVQPSVGDQARPSPASGSIPQQSAGGGVPEILQFKFESLSGTTVEGTAFAGKDLALWSWAPW